MRIALVYHRFHPNPGGVETYVRKLAEQYAASGHRAAVFTSEPYYSSDLRSGKTPHDQNFLNTRENRQATGDPEILRTQKDGIRVPGGSAKTAGYEVHYIRTKTFLGYPLPLKKDLALLEKFNPDIIHVNSPHPYSTSFAFHSRKLKKPVITTYHGHANPANRFKKAASVMEHHLYRLLFKLLIVTSDYYKNEVSAFYPPAKISTVPLGIDPAFGNCALTRREARDALDIGHNRKIVLFVGAMDAAHYYKGLNYLLECAARTPDIEYLVVGSGAEKPYFEKNGAAMSNVTFCGFVEDDKLPLFYRAADCLALPSTSNSEGFGLVLLEAMASGTPVITTGATGSAGLIRSSGAGLIVKAKDTHSLKEGIIKILGDGVLRSELVANGLALAKPLTWANTARKTLQIYDKLIRENRHRKN